MDTDDQGGDRLNLCMIEASLTASMVCSNLNRLCILYLLRKCETNCMQAEKIASNLGISHRTALYHLDVLKDYGLVEVREFRKKGAKLLRSVWGLSTRNDKNLNMVFKSIGKKLDLSKLDEYIIVEPCEAIQRKERVV